jgi:Flp pilus assembly protein TadG
MSSLRRFIIHSGGVSAIEFAFVAPMLILLLAGIVTGWTYSMQLMEMRTAVKTGANYVLQGGTDLDAVESAVLMSWTNQPDDATVGAVRECYCSDAVHACSTVCTDKSTPNMSVIITATGSVDTPLSQLFTSEKVETTREEIIRVR